MFAYGHLVIIKKISLKAKNILEQENVKIYVSPISLFEIAIKLNIGKLVDLEIPFADFIKQIKDSPAKILPIADEHLIAYSLFNFDNGHRDPFDRYLIATAYFEKKAIISCDEKFKLYTDWINVIW